MDTVRTTTFTIIGVDGPTRYRVVVLTVSKCEFAP